MVSIIGSRNTIKTMVKKIDKIFNFTRDQQFNHQKWLIDAKGILQSVNNVSRLFGIRISTHILRDAEMPQVILISLLIFSRNN
jgi:hypothetical protein